MRRLIRVVIACSVALVVSGPVAAQGEPPQQREEPVWIVTADQSGHVLFVNVTADDFCAWLAAGAPPSPPDVGELVTVQRKVTGQGAIVETFRATVGAELWTEAEPGAICDGGGERLGTGTVVIGSTDNDLFLSGTRANAFGGRLHGTISGDAGSWRVSGVFRALISDGQFRLLHESLRVTAVR
jgi:hypothetical protein